MGEREFDYIINLLEDPDKKVFEEISKNLIAQGVSIIPELEKIGTKVNNLRTQERLEEIIKKIHFDYVQKSFREWVCFRNNNLLEGAFLIAKYLYPDLQYNTILDFIDKLTNQIWLEINNDLLPQEKIKVINYILYKTCHFIGNTDNLVSPYNYYINQVIETKKTAPISIGILYLAITQRLGLPVSGVILPNNFVLAFTDFSLLSEIRTKVLFYINPFNSGVIFSEREIDLFLEKINVKKEKHYYNPCSNVEIINRLIEDLILIYTNMGQNNKAEDFGIFKQLLSTAV